MLVTCQYIHFSPQNSLAVIFLNQYFLPDKWSHHSQAQDEDLELKLDMESLEEPWKRVAINGHWNNSTKKYPRSKSRLSNYKAYWLDSLFVEIVHHNSLQLCLKKTNWTGMQRSWLDWVVDGVVNGVYHGSVWGRRRLIFKSATPLL